MKVNLGTIDRHRPADNGRHRTTLHTSRRGEGPRANRQVRGDERSPKLRWATGYSACAERLDPECKPVQVVAGLAANEARMDKGFQQSLDRGAVQKPAALAAVRPVTPFSCLVADLYSRKRALVVEIEHIPVLTPTICLICNPNRIGGET